MKESKVAAVISYKEAYKNLMFSQCYSNMMNLLYGGSEKCDVILAEVQI